MSAPTVEIPTAVGALLAGACHCGCGEQAPLAHKTDRKIGAVKGQPRRYVNGHNGRLARTMQARPARRREARLSRRHMAPEPGPWAIVCTLCPWPLTTGRARPPRGFRRHEGRGLCTVCYRHAQAEGTLLDHERRYRTRDDILDDWTVLREQGHGRRVAAERLGMSFDAFDKALRRAARDGDRRAVWGPP